MSNSSEPQRPLSSDIREHSPEGVEILHSEPSSLFRWTILLILCLLTAILLWSLFARADVIVTAQGVLSSEDELRRVYSPVNGELEALLIREEEPLVQAGDPIARLRSIDAARLRAEAAAAEAALAEVEISVLQRPAQRALDERQIELQRDELASREERLDRRLIAGSESLRVAQQARLEQARATRNSARDRQDEEKARYDAMLQLAGVANSQVEVNQQRVRYEDARREYQVAVEALKALEQQFVAEAEADNEELEQDRLEIEQLRIDLETAPLKIAQTDAALEASHAIARENLRAARQVQFDETSDGGFVLVPAPVSGIVTNFAYSQPGDKVQANTPLVSIAPEGSRKVLEIDILESDRGLLVEGSRVRMKFGAFPYQQYGIIEGTLEFISPTTRQLDPSSPPTYRGKVSLDRDFVEVDGNRRPLRFGMSATAEIVVRRRRVIDLILDPMRRS
jgi:hemolysin D